MTALLETNALRKVYLLRTGLAHRARLVAADDVSFSIERGRTLALVVESGSGKTTVGRCILRLEEPTGGEVQLDGRTITDLRPYDLRRVRREMQMVYQDPLDSLNPRHRIGDAIARPARILRGLSGKEARAETTRLLERVRLPGRLADRFPAELSGGERQRVAIARALAADPELVVCDEITSALDVSVQAAVLELLAELRAQLGLALLFITHDLGVVASVADRVLVLDRGAVCESGPVASLLAGPQHEYTRRLVEAAPRVAQVTGAA